MASPGVGRRAHNLPIELTSFVGRRQELAEVKRLLATTRLLTLTGPGGAGKTRLALRAAAEMARAFPDGVWLVELAPLDDPMLVNQALFGALGLQDVSARWSVSTLAEYLGDKRTLLVLDNCEHLLDACAVLVDTLLRACPELRFLTTSREALGAVGEVRMRVPSLSLPEAEGPLSAAAVFASDALALFEARAMAVAPGFQVEASNVAAVASVCRRLDGIPLALELAAVRLDTLSVDHLASGLDGALRIPGEGSRGAVPRQRTLEATIDWSHHLLNDAERQMWARLSVFAGGFDLDAAVRVTGDQSLPASSVPPLVGGLVAKSIVMRDDGGGEDRYRLLETLREYGRDRLRESTEEKRLRGRHRDWVLELAASAAVPDARQAEAFDRVERNLDNLWSAIDFCLAEPGDAVDGLRICSDLRTYWIARGPITDARRLLSSLLDLTPDTDPARADGLVVAGLLALGQNDIDAAKPLLEESLRSGRTAANSNVVGWSLGFLGLVAAGQQRGGEAISLCRTAMTLGRAMHDPVLAAASAMMVVLLMRQPELRTTEDDLSQALEDAEQSLTELEILGELWMRSFLLLGLAQLHRARGELDLAEELLRRAVTMKQRLGDLVGLASTLETLSWCAASAGNMRRAAQLLGWDARVRDAMGSVLLEVDQVDHDRTVAAARSGLGDAAYSAAHNAGAAMTTEEIVGFALGEEPPAHTPPSKPRERASRLTPREMEISRLITEGMQTKQIAAKLFISERTVETHVTNILNKLGLGSRLQLARWVLSQDEAPTI